MDQALVRAVGQDWRPDAVKSLLLVADAPPHDDKFARNWAAAEAARAKRIHITPVAASGGADKAEYAMRAVAEATQSAHLFLNNERGEMGRCAGREGGGHELWISVVGRAL